VYRLFLALRYLRSRLVNLISIAGVMAGVAVLIVVPVFYEYETVRASILGAHGMAWHQMHAIGIDWSRERQVSELASYILVATDPENPLYHPVAEERLKTTVLVSRTFAENFMLGQRGPDGAPRHPYGALRDEYGGALEGEAMLAGCREIIGQDLRIMWGAARAGPGGERQISTNSKNLVISGVYDAHDAMEDNRRLYIGIDSARTMGQIDHEYLQVNVKLDDYEYAASVKQSMSLRYTDRFIVETWEDQKADFLRAVNNEKVLLVIVLSFIVLLGGFIILATMTLTVIEKTRDIGIVGALGAGRGGILTIFLWNGLLIGLMGALLGLGLGYWFTANVNWVKDRLYDMGIDIFPPGIYHFRQIPTVWDWPQILTILLGSVLVAFLAGVLPALRAARLDPIAALRHE